MIRNLKFVLLLFAFVGITSGNAFADIIISNAGVTTTIDFESTLSGSNNGAFAGAGFRPGATTVGTLDSNSWSINGFGTNVAFGDDVTSGDPARGSSSGSVSTGGVYAFDASTDGGSIGVGVQPAGSDFTPGDITLRSQNGTGAEVTSFDIGYELRVFNDQGRANELNFEYSFDDSTYIQVGAFDFTSDEAADGSPSWELTTFSTTISGISLADTANLFFRWVGDDVSGSGSRDQFQIDNIDITFNTTAVPEPGTIGMLAAVACGFGFLRRRKNQKTSEV